MLKVKKVDKLPIEAVRGIRRWLKEEKHLQSSDCPFARLKAIYMYADKDNAYSGCFQLCPFVFPTLEKKRLEAAPDDNGGRPFCPCSLYGRKYVIRRARIIAARNGRKKRDYTSRERGQEGPQAENQTSPEVQGQD